MNTTLRSPSRSISRNRWDRFATLYDPDGEPEQTEQSTEYENPAEQYDGSTLISLPLVMDRTQYKAYRKRLGKRQRTCVYCGNKLHGNGQPDHVTPKNRGGKNWPANLLLSCRECNDDKTDMTLAEWRSVLLQRIARIQNLADRVAMLISDGHECFVSGARIRTDHIQQPQPEGIS